MSDKQKDLFDDRHEWRDYWDDMPYFYPPTRNTEQRNLVDVTDLQDFCSLKTNQKPIYPVYIISKGRHENPQTARSLESMGIAYKIVIEPSELCLYEKTVDRNNIIVAPENFSQRGNGGIPARNFVMNLSIANGDKRHWILDDNINGFGYQKSGRRVNTKTNGDMFGLCEKYVDKFKNVKMAGIRYRFHHNYVKTPYVINTRIYSCILIDNSIDQEWRGKFNEDTDLSLRVLKEGGCTMLFTWCYCNKAATMTTQGGNTDGVYKETDNRKEFAESLKNQHPDVVKVVKKFGRWHHHVDYSSFKKNQLIKS